uniref:Trichohyalin-plectin-homology domain-containing protein n=1 Tax=Echeneis naucrates TaxID=173247 RepID=A0A665SZ01_ECHNA
MHTLLYRLFCGKWKDGKIFTSCCTRKLNTETINSIGKYLLKPKPKAPTRMEIVERNLLHHASMAEDKLVKARQRKLLAERKLRDQAKEEHRNMLAAEEREMKKQDRQQAVDNANLKMFHQTSCARKFNRAVQRTQMQKENEALIQFHREQKKMVEDRNRQSEEEMRSRLKEALRQEQQKAQQRRFYNCSVADFQSQQIKEKKLLKEKMRQQEKEEGDALRKLDELHAQELKTLSYQEAESKKRYLKYRLEDIHSRDLLRQRQAEEIHMAEAERKRVQSDIEQKIQQRKNDQAEKLRNRQIQIEIVKNKLSDTMRDEAASRTVREQTKLSKEVAEQDIKRARQQKEKLEKKDAELKSIAAHREAKIQEKRQKEKERLQNDLNWSKAQQKSARLFIEDKKLKAQRAREADIKDRDFNAVMAAERRAHVEQLKSKDREAEVKEAEKAAENERKLQQYIQSEHRKAAEDERNTAHLSAVKTGEPALCCMTTWEPLPRRGTNQTCLMKRYLDCTADTTPNHLPPLTRAPSNNSTEKGERLNSSAKCPVKLLPRRSTSHAWCPDDNKTHNKVQFVKVEGVKIHPKTRLPPVSKFS